MFFVARRGKNSKYMDESAARKSENENSRLPVALGDGDAAAYPEGFVVTFNPGAAWRRLYSLSSIRRTTRRTSASL